MTGKEGYKEYKERCRWCESIRTLHGTRQVLTDDEGNPVCNGHWNIEYTGFKCKGHEWRKTK